MIGDNDDEEVRYYALYEGVVIDRVDPEGLGRVRARVPGLMDASAWAWPRGGTGGGTDRRGHFDVPELGAEVYIQFVMGDPDRPTYESGHWGRPTNQDREVPERVKDATVAETPNVRAYETRYWAVLYDDRNDSQELVLLHKPTGAQLRLGPQAGKDFLALGTTLAAWQKRVMDLLIAHNHGTGMGPSGPPLNAASLATEEARIDEHVSGFAALDE